ncbi:ABC transporter ATP-binding protein [Conexibacter sp. JD483]|nr:MULTISPECIES: ABC transporter ATP-binding protein [unclassified Conexibacter]MDO8187095.1 ABC transporter ATP-binding protein [Conexibacter sp. CPCC 205706]MDO8200953.1 ABC transporter ATP-binding protein [Conexibacter sp. CPCC 205762]MDR9371894.1 ABC transporter ATP-binding protein [Conexibacter sp. JD483]
MTAISTGGLACEQLSVHFPVREGLLGKAVVHAVEQVDFRVAPGEVVGLVGESGCGKSTLAKVLVGLQRPTGGTLRYGERDVWSMSRDERRRLFAREVAMVFQDPASSLNPRWRVGDLVRDPLDVHEVGTASSRKQRVAELIELVGLSASVADRLPRQLSGGQRQRVAIARALALDPAVVIADEPTSALDVSVKAQILNLLDDLRARLDLSMVFISHDIHAVRHVADRIAVMYLGRVVEEGPAEALAASPRHPYTKALFSAVPTLAGRATERIVLEGPVPSARKPPPGCPFATRCWKVQDDCRAGFPVPKVDGDRRHWCSHPLA